MLLGMPKFWFGLVSLVCVVMVGCGPVGDVSRRDLSGRDEIRAVATVGMVGDIVAKIGRGRVSVETLMGPGIDPHVYKASEGDLRRLERADAIFFSGLHLEAKMGDVLERIGEGRVVVAAAEGIPAARLRREPNGAIDPHVWFDVELWALAARRVASALSAADPEHAETYRANEQQYLAELDALDRYVQQRAQGVPVAARVLVTAHDAFGYFGAAYGFEVIGLQGISTASEAGARDVARLADLIATRRIPAVFIETSVSPRTIRAVQEAVAARGFEVAIGGSLFSDAMGSAGTPAGTYQGMVRHNIDTIADALGGTRT